MNNKDTLRTIASQVKAFTPVSLIQTKSFLDTLSVMANKVPAKWRVLVIDDDPDFRLLLETALPKDIAVETSSSGEEGLEAARYGKFDLIIMDVMMPGIHGFHALERLKNDNNEIVSRIMVTSNLPPDQVEVQAAEAGAGYLNKDIPIKSLVAKVQQTLLTH
jgi:CheY-like chemotaxis protein